MNKITPFLILFLNIVTTATAQNFTSILVNESTNLIRDVIVEDIDNQGNKEIILSYADTGLVQIFELNFNEDAFRKTENDLGLKDFALATADFSGDGKTELIMGWGDIFLFQPCANDPFCFEKTSQELISEGFYGTTLLPTFDGNNNLILLGTGPYQTDVYRKQGTVLENTFNHRLTAATVFRKHFFATCDEQGRKEILREYFSSEHGHWLYLDKMTKCADSINKCKPYFQKDYYPFELFKWDYTHLFFGDIDEEKDIEVLYGRNDTIFVGCSEEEPFFTGEKLPIQSLFFDFDGDNDADIISAPRDTLNMYFLVYYENLGGGLFEADTIDENLTAKPYYPSPDVIIDDLNKDGVKDIIVHTRTELLWFNFAKKELTTAFPSPEKLEFMVYPNPVESEFFIDTDKEITHLFLYDTQGRLLKEYDTNSSLDLPVEKGLYILQIGLKNNNGNSIKNRYARLVKN